ncbi:MAG: YggT family protein [bacterium]|nr:YggT family protein [bacterium]
MELVIGLADFIKWSCVIYGWMILGAFLLSWIHADPNNGMVRFINNATQPFWYAVSHKLPLSLVPLAPIVALFLVDYAEVFLPGLVRSVGAMLVAGLPPETAALNIGVYALLAGLMVLRSIMFFLGLLCVLYFIFGVVAPSLGNPIVRSVTFMIDPFLRPLQRLLPRASVDLSPVVLGLGLYIGMTAMMPLFVTLQRQLSI